MTALTIGGSIKQCTKYGLVGTIFEKSWVATITVTIMVVTQLL